VYLPGIAMTTSSFALRKLSTTPLHSSSLALSMGAERPSFLTM